MDSETIDVRRKVFKVTSIADKKTTPFKGQTFETLRNECLRTGRLFEDPIFPAVDTSMFYTQSPPSGIKWKRPKEICSSPAFVVGTANANDLDQGYLGNCWFVAGCASIVLVPELFSNVVPSDQDFSSRSYAGIFHFRFWYYGDWVDVVVDDRLPVYPDNRLLFCSNKQEPSEFWAALLEKAYAKLSLCYENLDGGNTTDALIDMSGGIQEQFEIKDMQREAQKTDMWKILVKSRQHKSLIGSSIAPNPRVREARLSNGLVMGHAYTVTRVACIEIGAREIRLIRVRNPWGNEVEWKGSWSDASYEWNAISDDVKRALEYKRSPDGEFWMNFDDFYRNFETIQFCDLTPDAFSDELLRKQDPKNAPKLTWKLTAYNGEWIPGKSSGGSGRGNDPTYWTNPQFLVTLSDNDPDDNEQKATIIISLLQKYTREKRMKRNGDSAEEFIQFRLYRILNSKDADAAKRTGQRLYASQLERIATSGPYINQRDITHRYRTTTGSYVIIPSCYDVGRSGEFLLRLYTEQPIGDNSAVVLTDHKVRLDESDKFFKNPVSLDDAFSSWTNLIGSGNDAGRIYSKSQVSSDANNNSQYAPYGARSEHRHTALCEFKVYSDNAHGDVWHKVDKKNSSRR